LPSVALVIYFTGFSMLCPDALNEKLGKYNVIIYAVSIDLQPLDLGLIHAVNDENNVH